MNETTPDYKDPLNLTASFIMILLGIMGVTSNILIIYIFIRSPIERTSFNVICVFRAYSNTFILVLTFFGTFIPITLIGDSPFSPFYETIVIGMANTTYSALQNSGIYIALNRFCAMFMPIYYQKLFGFKTTCLVTFLLYGWRIFKIIIEFFHFIPLECWMTYISSDLTWYPNMDPKCNEDSSSEINSTAIVVFVVASLNVATFSKIYFFYKSTDVDIKEQNRKIRKNRALFLQTMIQDVITLVDMIFTFRLSLLSNARAWTFFCGTVIWECVHSFDGVIMVMFNERLTFLKRVFFTSSANPSHVQSAKMTATVIPSMHPARVD